MKLAAIPADPFIADGQQFGAGEVVAIIETDIPADNLLSALRFSRLNLVPIDDAVALRTDTTPAPINNVQPAAGIDPDALNAQDRAADEAAEAAAAATNPTRERGDASDDDTNPTRERGDEVPEEFTGLTARVVGILSANGMSTAAQVKAWVESGKELTDLDGIGKAAAAKIKTIAGIA